MPSLNYKLNRLLAVLPKEVLQRWRPRLELVELTLGQVLHEPGGVQSHVYFPTTAIVSLLYVLVGQRPTPRRPRKACATPERDRAPVSTLASSQIRPIKDPRIARSTAGLARGQRRPKYPAMNKTMTTRPTSQMILFTIHSISCA